MNFSGHTIDKICEGLLSFEMVELLWHTGMYTFFFSSIILLINLTILKTANKRKDE